MVSILFNIIRNYLSFSHWHETTVAIILFSIVCCNELSQLPWCNATHIYSDSRGGQDSKMGCALLWEAARPKPVPCSFKKLSAHLHPRCILPLSALICTSLWHSFPGHSLSFNWTFVIGKGVNNPGYLCLSRFLITPFTKDQVPFTMLVNVCTRIRHTWYMTRITYTWDREHKLGKEHLGGHHAGYNASWL
jgi:hypothetical protein